MSSAVSARIITRSDATCNHSRGKAHLALVFAVGYTCFRRKKLDAFANAACLLADFFRPADLHGTVRPSAARP
jgi:hypothetical protein